VTVESIIKWADIKIYKQDDNDIFFDLSIARTKNNIIEILSKRVIWDFRDEEIRRIILSYYNEYLKCNFDKWPEIQNELIAYFHLIEYHDSNESTEDFLYYLDDDLQLRKDGFRGSLQMPTFIIENLSQYNYYDELTLLLTREEITGYEIKNNYT